MKTSFRTFKTPLTTLEGYVLSEEVEEETDRQEEEDVPYLQGAELDLFLDSFEMNLGEQESTETPETYYLNFIPKKLNLNKIRKKEPTTVAVTSYVKLRLVSTKRITWVVSS